MGVITVPRYYFGKTLVNDIMNLQLHGFSDVSEKAYGAVAYLCAQLEGGEVVTNLISLKTRVAPINGETIPRLELLGALILGRLIDSLLTAFAGVLEMVGKW